MNRAAPALHGNGFDPRPGSCQESPAAASARYHGLLPGLVQGARAAESRGRALRAQRMARVPGPPAWSPRAAGRVRRARACFGRSARMDTSKRARHPAPVASRAQRACGRVTGCGWSDRPTRAARRCRPATPGGPERMVRSGPPRPHRFDPGAIDGMASPDPETRASAWERLYTQDYVLTELSGSAAPQDTRRDGGSFEWAGYAVRVARQLEPRFRIRDGAVLRPVGDPEDFAQEAWLRLGVRARKEPLELRSPDLVQGFQAYLAMIVRNVILDARRKLRGQPGAAAQLRGLLARCTTDAERYTLQAAVDLAREGERWDDVAEIARRTGQTHAAVAEILARVERLRLAAHPASQAAGGDDPRRTAEIRHALFEYAKG